MRLLLVQSGSYRLAYCLWIVWKFCWCISSGSFIIRAITDLCTNWIHMTTHLHIGHTNCEGTNTQGMEVPMDLPFSELQGPLVSFRKFSQFAGVFWCWWFQVLSQRYICILYTRHIHQLDESQLLISVLVSLILSKLQANAHTNIYIGRPISQKCLTICITTKGSRILVKDIDHKYIGIHIYLIRIIMLLTARIRWWLQWLFPISRSLLVCHEVWCNVFSEIWCNASSKTASLRRLVNLDIGIV